MKRIVLAAALASIGFIGCGRKSADDISDKGTSIERRVFTPSGDWNGNIRYTYGKDGRLRHISYEFSTFGGYDKISEDFQSTHCIREYDVSEEGKMHLKSKVTTDLATGKSVDRAFYEPQIAHWMTLAEAQQGLKTEDGQADSAP